MADDSFSYWSYSSSYWIWSERWYFPTWSVVLILSVICLVTIAGNLLVILAYMRDRVIRRTAAYTIILNLAIVDILVGAVILSVSIVWWILGSWVFGTVLCKIWLVIDYSLFTMSTFTVVFISLDRYWLVTKGLGYQKFQTKRLVSVVLATAWSLSIFYHIIIGFVLPVVSPFENEFASGSCELEVVQSKWFNILELVLKFAIPFSALVFLNVSVYCNIVVRSRGLVSTARKLGITAAESTTGGNTATETEFVSNDGSSNKDASGSNENGKASLEPDEEATRGEAVYPVILGSNAHGSNEDASNEGTRNDLKVVAPIDTKLNDGVAIGKLTSEVTPDQEAVSVGTLGNARRLPPLSKPVQAVSGNMKPDKDGANKKDINEQKEDFRQKKTEFKKYRKAAITLGVIVLAYCLCFLPFFVYSIIVSFCKECLHYLPWEIVNYLVWCKSACNPLLYGFTNLLLRRNFVKILRLDSCSRRN